MAMRIPFALAFAGILALGIPVHAMDMPLRKAGLWELRMVMEGAGMPAQTMRQCTDAATDKEMRSFSRSMGGGQCEQQSFEKSATGYTFESSCALGARKVITRGTVTGDFNSAYTIDMISTGGPAAGGEEVKMHMAAKWLGPCKAGQKPGDIVMPGGMTINVNRLKQMRSMMPGGAARP